MKPTAPQPVNQQPPATLPASSDPGGIVARAAGGAIAGAFIGIIADPFTAVVGAVACAVIGGTAGFDTEEE